ncbi:MAG: hypothetical protein IJL27_00980 [Firmicutes bacterium]|nr:hypothetical protein [Bacillota bacterium]
MWDRIWDKKKDKPESLEISTFLNIATLTAFTTSRSLQLQRLRAFSLGFQRFQAPFPFSFAQVFSVLFRPF